MKKYRCTNDSCKQPILFEGDFVGTVKKICPKCKQMIEFIETNNNKFEKTC